MQFVFAKDGVKREISGPFQMCCGINDLKELKRIIDAQVERNVAYGWFDVIPPLPWQSEPSTSPKGWTEP